MHGFIILITLIGATIGGIGIGASIEREGWCQHTHQMYKAVETCRKEPDWRSK